MWARIKTIALLKVRELTLRKLGFYLLLSTLLFWLLETAVFGFNLRAASRAEEVCDGIVAILVVISVAMLWFSPLKPSPEVALLQAELDKLAVSFANLQTAYKEVRIEYSSHLEPHAFEFMVEEAVRSATGAKVKVRLDEEASALHQLKHPGQDRNIYRINADAVDAFVTVGMVLHDLVLRDQGKL
jgi:hypothetical protein